MSKDKKQLKTYKLIWAPEGKHIATVRAHDPQGARRKARPYKKFLGEIAVEEVAQ